MNPFSPTFLYFRKASQYFKALLAMSWEFKEWMVFNQSLRVMISSDTETNRYQVILRLYESSLGWIIAMPHQNHLALLLPPQTTLVRPKYYLIPVGLSV